MPDPAPNAELLRSLGRLVRGLSALFWGLPITLIACFYTAKGDWLKPFGIVPPLVTTGLLTYGLWQLGDFQKQERVWRTALDRALVFSLINFGLSLNIHFSFIKFSFRVFRDFFSRKFSSLIIYNIFWFIISHVLAFLTDFLKAFY